MRSATCCRWSGPKPRDKRKYNRSRWSSTHDLGVGMHLTDGRLILSASDLTGFLECPHLTQQELAATRGELVRPKRDDPELELMARHGTEHEQAHLDAYALAGKSVTRIETWGATMEAYSKAREQTLEAMRSGVDVIYQATLFD